MPLTKEQLLIRRWKVIAGIPFKPAPTMYAIGDIITDDGKECARDQNGDAVFVCDWDKYPHIFQPLPWWSDRKPEDMPEYVRYSEYYLNHYHLDGDYKRKIFKIDKWDNGHYGIKANSDGIIHGYEINFEPADESEYTAYINQKQ